VVSRFSFAIPQLCGGFAGIINSETIGAEQTTNSVQTQLVGPSLTNNYPSAKLGYAAGIIGLVLQFFTLKPSRSNVNGKPGDTNLCRVTSPIKTISVGALEITDFGHPDGQYLYNR
jgi:hypothetical protein